MPNHVKNKLELIGSIEDIERMFSMFNTHKPASLKITHDNLVICRDKNAKDWSCGWFNLKTGMFKRRGMDNISGLPDGWELEILQPVDMFPDFEKVIAPPENIFNGDLGEEERQMCIKEGRPNWYDWNVANWGTKWNSYSHEKESYNVFTFETAWSSVVAIVLEMSKKFPEVEIVYSYADENTGYNCGILRFKGGELLSKNIPAGGSCEAYELAFSLRPDIAEEYKLVDGEYEYVEEEE